MEGSRRTDEQLSHAGPIPIRGGPPTSPSRASDAATRQHGSPSTSPQRQPDVSPTHSYRGSSRSVTRSTEEQSPRSSVSSGRSSLDAFRLSPPIALGRERSYSPLAAGFARLSQKDATPGSSPGGSKSSLELESKMFAGPA
jgi:hypothetical protein